MACRRRRECDPDRGSALPTSAQDERRDREVGRRKRKFSAHRRAAAYTARSSVASPKSRTTFSFDAEERNGKPGGFPRQCCGLPKLRESRGKPPPPDDAGNRRRHRNRRRDEHNRPAENEQSRRERATRREGNNRRRSPGRASGHVPQDSPRDFAQTNTTRPALSFPGTGAPPRAQKRRSAKPKFCRTPDRHDSGLARSLNRTFSYRMKLVRMTGSFSGSGTPAALPASKQRSIHAMFLAS